MLGSNMEAHTFMFSSDIQGNEDHHGVGFCFNHKIEIQKPLYNTLATSLKWKSTTMETTL